MANKRKYSSKKTKIQTKKASVKRKPIKAIPPPDDPLRRHEEMDIDRIIISDKKVLVTEVAVGARTKTRRRLEEESEIKKTARFRLGALEQARSQRDFTLGMAPVGGSTVPPAPGISNWVQMGPVAIPQGQTYSPERVQVTGRITAIVVDPTDRNIIYVGAAQGGVWKSADGGKNWNPTSDNEISLAIGALAMDPSNHLVLYAGTGEGNFSGDSYYGNGVLKTTDGGASWTTLATSTFMGARFSNIGVTPGAPTRLFSATGNGIYRSTDGAITWTQMTNGLPNASATDVAIDSASPSTVYGAFWGQGIYKTTNADAASPAWTKLTSGLPGSGFSRIALGISPSSPQTVYALIATSTYVINGFYRTTNGGSSWNSIPLPGGNIGGQGFYNLSVAVDPTTPDIVYLNGVSVWKATRNPLTDTWTITDIGSTIHPDNHAFAFDPLDHEIVYAGNDGGIYKSANGGSTWSDAINSGLCITQFEFIDQHPTSDAVVFGGTQDNGTEQFRNSPVFNHADDGDGGYCLVDFNQPNNVLSTYYYASPKRSTQGGKFATWFNVSGGISGNSLFYPPLVIDQTNPNNVAIGTDRINLDSAQGTGGWPTKVTLPGITGYVSAIHYANSALIYVGTTSGRVYRLANNGVTWTASLISASPLPSAFIWDVMARPDDLNTVIVVMSGFGISHVWSGAVPATGAATWTNISGIGVGTLPDIPVNALVIDPNAPDTMYIATDVAVFRTINRGASWTQFSQGLPNCAVFDMRLHGPSRLLRVGTHGRGMWEKNLDVPSLPNVDIFFRDHLMDSGRVSPSPTGVIAAFEDQLQYVALGSQLWQWMCADIKVDTLEGSPPDYQIAVTDVDYVVYESGLEHRNAQRGRINRVYVQVHNRGIGPAASVTVKLFYANASAGLPPLPPDFWTAFPNDSIDTTNWHPIGAPKVIASLSNTEPAILEWDWSTPTTAADHSCLLAVMDCAGDPIPAVNKIFDTNSLIGIEKRVGLKNLHVINALPGTTYLTTLHFWGPVRKAQSIRIMAPGVRKGSLGMIFPRTLQEKPILEGVSLTKASASVAKSLREKLGADIEKYDVTRLYAVDTIYKGGKLANLSMPKDGLQAILVIDIPSSREFITFSVTQEDEGKLVGGSTFVVRPMKNR